MITMGAFLVGACGTYRVVTAMEELPDTVRTAWNDAKDEWEARKSNFEDGYDEILRKVPGMKLLGGKSFKDERKLILGPWGYGKKGGPL